MSTAKTAAVPDADTRLHLLVCLGADFDRAYIPHLCRHYKNAVDSWIVLLHTKEFGEEAERVTAAAGRAFESGLADVSPDAKLNTRVWLGEFDPYTKVNNLNDSIRALVSLGNWVLYVDADEFVESPDNLKSLLARSAACEQKVVYGSMVDRFARDKKPHPLNDDDDLFEKFPLREEYTKTTLRAWSFKPCLMKYEGKPLLNNCHDYSGQNWSDYKRSGRPVLTVWHFKWVESTREKLKNRVSSFWQMRLGWWRESDISLQEIYGEETSRLRGLAVSHPYASQEARAFWKTGVSEGKLAQFWRPKWRLRPEDRVVTFGSCFARHLGPALRTRGFSWWESEPPPSNLSPENALRFGYGRFSCRTGTITTTTLLRQWVDWALGEKEPPDEHWISGDRVVDPFRPSIEPDGFVSRAEMLASRKEAISSLKRAILKADVFLFTLGMTESWVNEPGGWVYPACPGTVAGCFDPRRHRFLNLSFLEARQALVGTLERMWALRPELLVLLTVSPVPLSATASGHHVLTATTGSKAILRAIAGELADRKPRIEYFPAYELVTSTVFGDHMFEANRRTVSEWGRDRVMDIFFAAHGNRKSAGYGAGPALPDPSMASDPDCDDAWVEAFGK